MLNKKMIMAGLCVCMLSVCAACSGKGGDSAQVTEGKETVTEAATEAAAVSESGEKANADALPSFRYNEIYGIKGSDPVEAAAYDYLAFDAVKDSDPNHAVIPYVKVISIDDSNPKDVLLYGDFWLWEFEKHGDVLVMVSGGHRPGVIHLERSGEGDAAVYSAISMDEALTDDENQKIFGKYYDQFQKVSSDDKTRDAEMKKILSDYVKANNLKVTRYQFSDGQSKELPL